MRRCISALTKVGHIRQITDGRWLFKALLAAKPHQEYVCNIEDFVWHFCVNYILLNGVTRIIAYRIPGCNSAVFNEFGRALWWWRVDAPMGYHQLAVNLASQEKLAFQVSRGQCHQMDLHSYASWTNQWASDLNQFHPRRR